MIEIATVEVAAGSLTGWWEQAAFGATVGTTVVAFLALGLTIWEARAARNEQARLITREVASETRRIRSLVYYNSLKRPATKAAHDAIDTASKLCGDSSTELKEIVRQIAQSLRRLGMVVDAFASSIPDGVCEKTGAKIAGELSSLVRDKQNELVNGTNGETKTITDATQVWTVVVEGVTELQTKIEDYDPMRRDLPSSDTKDKKAKGG